KAASAQHLASDRSGFLAARRENHAFTRGQAVGFYHDFAREVLQRVVEFGFIVRKSIFRGWNVVAAHELLGEALARFELRRGFCRAKDAKAASRKFVDN